jgi:hypothetical protein
MTFCVPLPTSHRFFRIVDGFATSTSSSSNVVSISSAQFATNGFELRWTNAPDLRFGVQWTAQLPQPWNWFTNLVTPTNTDYRLLDDGSQTGGRGSSRFYRLILLP